jgi:hypothetical protein
MFMSNTEEYNVDDSPSNPKTWFAWAVYTHPLWLGGLLSLAALSRKRRMGVVLLTIATLPVAAMLWLGLDWLRYAFWPS